jgi:hypothetical protein
LTDKALHRHVAEECHKATSNKIVRASLLALSDPGLKGSSILHTIYALVIKHRLDPSSNDDVEEPETVVEAPKKTKKSRAKRRAQQASPH